MVCCRLLGGRSEGWLCGRSCRDLPHDVIGGLAPDKWLLLCIVEQELIIDDALEIVDAGHSSNP